LTFLGRNVHPGYAKNKMINAVAIAARYIAGLPEWQTPEHSEKREGFWHLTALKGDENRAFCKLILRSFDRSQNEKHIEFIRQLCHVFERRYDGLKIDISIKDQYQNMQEVLDQYPNVTAKAVQAIENVGLTAVHKPVRGGTDGARLSFMGMPTPNIFAGGLMFHSKIEWIPQIALQKGAQVILELCNLWSKEK
jgi:tripeptide aminopeptidase